MAPKREEEAFCFIELSTELRDIVLTQEEAVFTCSSKLVLRAMALPQRRLLQGMKEVACRTNPVRSSRVTSDLDA